MTAKIYPIKPQRPAVSEICRWSEAMESVTMTNVRLAYIWPRIWLRAVTGV